MTFIEKLKTFANMISILAIPLVVAYIGNDFTKSIKEREIQGKFVELAINILNQQPTKENVNIREWATEVIDKYSGVPFTKETQKDLINNLPLNISEIYKDIVLPKTSDGPLRIENNLLRGAKVKYELSPNTSGKVSITDLKAIVIHSTQSLSITSSVKWLTNDKAKASCHIIIDREGNITQLVPFNYIAWHAGMSQYKSLNHLNSFSIGIELVNGLNVNKINENKFYGVVDKKEIPADEITKAKHKNETVEKYWHNYSPEQISTVTQLCKLLRSNYNIDIIVGHDDISQSRKIDPGPLFPMKELQKSVLGKELE